MLHTILPYYEIPFQNGNTVRYLQTFRCILCISVFNHISAFSSSVSWSCCCCLVSQLCLTLCDPTNCRAPGLPVPHHLPKLAKVHVHCICDANQPSHPLMPSSKPSAFNLSQHQGCRRSGISLWGKDPR